MKKPLRIAMASSEVAPFAKTGGLADVTGALPIALERIGAETAIFLPKYPLGNQLTAKLTEVINPLIINTARGKEAGNVYAMTVGEKSTIYFIGNDKYYNRKELYGEQGKDYPDNCERFNFFCLAILKTLQELSWKTDIIHCHDWQTALIPTYLKTIFQNNTFFAETATVFTIHNLAYQGIFPKEKFPLLGLGWEYFTQNTLEFYDKLNVMKGGLIFADRLNTVSWQYSQEIQTSQYGCGLDGVLRERKQYLSGIVNGLDYSVWNPATDEYISAQYTPRMLKNKKTNKKQLLKSNGLSPDPSIPLVGIVTRLADQKGLDILSEAIEKLLKMDLYLVLLGTGEPKYHQLLEKIAQKYSDKVSINLKYDNKLAHQIYAGSDFFLMPSRFEPCGLGQLISLKYGTIPIVRKTGGLADTIKEFDTITGKGNGFVFEEYSAPALLDAVQRAISVYRQRKLWNSLIKKAMQLDHSWESSAREYLKLYDRARESKKTL